ncbi:MAG: hypothetical protein LBG71_04030 [Clostridiales Family XIII bacterium]|jgi:nitrogenase molybdenum-iron protein alpha chain|nr:hypothetical protein [Clostridiales Family XIII bacterium]
MSYISDSKTPPVRDSRLKIGIGFGGSVGDLLRASGKGRLLACDRSFCQVSACQLHLTLQMVMTMPDSVTIVHGASGCGAQIHTQDFPIRSGSAARGVKRGELIWMSTNLGERDVISGGEGKLREAILLVDREYRPRVIFVASSCAPNIIGDDIDEVADTLRGEVAADIIPLHCPGFKTRVVATAYDAVYHGLARNLELAPRPHEDFAPPNGLSRDIDEDKREYARRKARTVNLINASSIGAPDERELTELLRAIGLNVRVYTEYVAADDFRFLTEAGLNVSMCAVHDDYLLEHIKEKHGTPYIISSMPLGIAETREWLLNIAARTGDMERAEAVADAREAELRRGLAPFLPQIKGLRVLLSGGVIRVAAAALALKELGCQVVAVRPYHYDDLSDPIYERLERECPGLSVNVAPNQAFELVNIIKREKPDVVLSHGGSGVWATKAGAVSVPLMSPNQNYFAYTGMYELARRLARATQNDALQRRVGENARLPFKTGWYGRDPYSYIEQDRAFE